MRVRRRAAFAALLSAALIAELPASGIAALPSAARSMPRMVALNASNAVPTVRIPVKEPARAVLHPLRIDTMRPKTTPGIRPLRGIRVAGPPMLKPTEIDAAEKRSQARLRMVRSTQPQPLLSRTIAAPSRAGSVPGARTIRSLPSNPASSGSGINPWWEYQEQAVPGGGHLMVNVGTGNLVHQNDDMSIPHKGVALAFRRTYNSQSTHDVSGSDGAARGLYGNGWTNTFDAHLSGSSNGTLTVWDIDGARYDYTGSDAAGWSAPPGQHATLVWDQACGYAWTNKTGTIYLFFRVDATASCSVPMAQYSGYAGRLMWIAGRNRNTWITFSYSWDNGDSSATGKIANIAAATESGVTANLQFADVNGHRLLQTLLYPDGITAVSYYYDTSGNLSSVFHPSTSTSGISSIQWYGYQAIGTDNIMQYVASPNWLAACTPQWNNCGSDGAYLWFGFAGSSAVSSTLTSIQHVGVVNPPIADGSNIPLQSGYSNRAYAYLTEYFTTGTVAPTFRDTDGHMTNWIVDGSGRPTQRQECTSSTNQGQSCNGSWLVINQSWDAANNRIKTIDARGAVVGVNPATFATDYAFDAAGNTIAVAEPPQATSQGSFRPTRLFDYDGFNNVVAYCDQTQTHAARADWNAPPAQSDSLCASAANPAGVTHWQATFTSPGAEPNGELATMTAPDGYQTTYQYDPSRQGGTDYGLPTKVIGASGGAIAQFDGSTATPVQDLWYDSAGNVACSGNGVGTWVIVHDIMGRVTAAADPTDSGPNTSVCGKSWGGMRYTSTQYAASGAVLSLQPPSQRLVGVATQYSYDADGNVKSQVNYPGCTATPCSGAVTSKYYDGADRLVEVALPQSANDLNAMWITRYIYDLSQGAGVSFMGASVLAYGNLYKTSLIYKGRNQVITALDKNATAYDGIDRTVSSFTLEPGNNSIPRTTTFSFDASSATVGLLYRKTDQLQETTTFQYDAMGRTTGVQFGADGGVTPSRTMVYDPNGRVSSVQSSLVGTQQTMYDVAGRVSEIDEFAGGTQSLSSPARLRYAYYPNGQRRSLSVSSAAFTAEPYLSYAYRNDGARTKLQVSKGGVNSSFTWSYDDARRQFQQYDPYALATKNYDFAGGISDVRLAVHGVYSSLAHDAEGTLKSFTIEDPNGYKSLSGTFSLSPRGEALALQETETVLADGTSRTGQIWGRRSVAGALTDVPENFGNGVDLRTGAPGGPGVPPPIPQNCGVAGDLSPKSSYTYDAAGRQIAALFTAYDAESCNDNGWSSSTTYDAENHTTSFASNNYPSDTVGGGGAPIRWSPSGHPVYVGGATLHFDGDLLLFGTTASGSLQFLNVEELGQVATDNTIVVNDRDYAGLTVMQHGAHGYSAWDTTVSVVHFKSGFFAGWLTPAANGTSGETGHLQFPGFDNYVRIDGFEAGFGTVQGSRVSQQDGWTTPDAYAGEVHDPMSQMSYMWNRNNPYQYSDPSGFDAYIFLDPNAAMGNGHLSIAVINGKTGRGGTLWAQHPPNGEIHGREIIDRSPISVSDVQALMTKGIGVVRESTSAAQDAAMNARAQALFNKQQSSSYDAILCNCDQFVKDVLGAADPKAASVLHLVPRDDFMNLMTQGFTSGHEGSAPGGFMKVEKQ